MQPLPPPSLDWCLFLDVDGTLIELTDTPYDSRVEDSLKATLLAISPLLGGALALVSGRSIGVLDALFAPLQLPCAGLHGVERRDSVGTLHGALEGDERLDAARVILLQLVESLPGTLLEDKGRTLAVHYRLAPQTEPLVRETVMRVAGALGDDFHVQSGILLFEIKPRGATKGSAISAFMREPPFAGRTPVFAGDDLTDIDGLRAVESLGGISIAVGTRVQGNYQAENPAAIREWLTGCLATLTHLGKPNGV